MNCLAFDRLLDTGDLAALPDDALTHAVTCARCARSLAVARSLEAAFERHLAAADVAAPAGLAGAVMARVSLRQRASRASFVADLTPWWVGVAAQPSAVGAMVIAALLTWRGPWLLAATQRAFGPGGAAFSFAAGPLATASQWTRTTVHAFVPSSGGDWTTSIAIALCLSPLALVAGYALYRAAERLVEGPVRA